MNKGGRNLLLLGIGSVAIAIVTTSLSLVIYHNSGDIYLDRSRPGYLPEEIETDHETYTEDYKFSDSGVIDEQVIDEYLREIQAPVSTVKELQDPYPADSLSDKALGIGE